MIYILELKTIFYLEGKMKKFIVALSLLLMACSENTIDKTKFKNPVFNQTLEPLGKTSSYVYLTPTSVDLRESEDENSSFYKGKCDLIENEQDRITLECNGKWLEGTLHPGSEWHVYLTYVVKDILIPGCLSIESREYEILKDLSKQPLAIRHYCVTPPEDMLPRNN
jgi:hypothetical protein